MDQQIIIIILLSCLCLIMGAALIILIAAQRSNKNNFAVLARGLDETRHGLESGRRDIEEARRDLEDTRRSVTDNYLQIDSRLELVRSTVDARLASLQHDSTEQMERLRGENSEQLERMRRTVDEKLQETLDQRLARSFESVRSSLDEVYRGLGEMQGLAQGVGDLKKVLSNVKTRGILGEVQLGAILDQILSEGQYLVNTPIDPASSERVEYAVRMPGDGETPVLLPIDAKFPGDAYLHLMDAYDSADPEEISASRRLLAAAIRKAAKDIRDKYICPPYSTDFAVMFLPFEGLYAEAVNMGAVELLQREFKVMIAGPSTMAALLNSLQMGFRTLAIQKNAGRVWQVLGSVKSEFDKFGEVLTLAQQRITQANSELDKLIGTRTRMIQRTLKDVQKLGE